MNRVLALVAALFFGFSVFVSGVALAEAPVEEVAEQPTAGGGGGGGEIEQSAPGGLNVQELKDAIAGLLDQIKQLQEGLLTGDPTLPKGDFANVQVAIVGGYFEMPGAWPWVFFVDVVNERTGEHREAQVQRENGGSRFLYLASFLPDFELGDPVVLENDTFTITAYAGGDKVAERKAQAKTGEIERSVFVLEVSLETNDLHLGSVNIQAGWNAVAMPLKTTLPFTTQNFMDRFGARRIFLLEGGKFRQYSSGKDESVNRVITGAEGIYFFHPYEDQFTVVGTPHESILNIMKGLNFTAMPQRPNPDGSFRSIFGDGTIVIQNDYRGGFYTILLGNQTDTYAYDGSRAYIVLSQDERKIRFDGTPWAIANPPYDERYGGKGAPAKLGDLNLDPNISEEGLNEAVMNATKRPDPRGKLVKTWAELKRK